MTHAKAIASGERVAAGGLKYEELLKEPYHNVDLFSRLLPYFDKVLQNVNDPMHEISNTLKDVFGLLVNEKNAPMYFSTSRRMVEVTHTDKNTDTVTHTYILMDT
jgi:hypothetical protein